ncbi:MULTISPECIES: NrfD/PsrC family molybdoenzyme membrane anchor subunit [Mycolicibacterium]|uniref:NrfD/PsrC family molybdoenzyme membrane anchor subunit n=1 Tax=Mycolicibacterium TaxID=1866885 RepID=UPI001E3CF0B4|nr:NrfD/PsrC family molybdoenzyme membrane anchor subunit [Mycolicibacterium mageritense]MBN3456050.1 polysulfide reductase NrfD [Mycobacterium sp. DSM 3803]GJJ22896.1 nitrite reductase [Mycolicibacterium mageritense]
MSEFDSYRPPEPARRRRGGVKRRRGLRGGGDGAREMPMVPEAEFTSYYGRPVVKPPPWGHEVAAYLFLGGVAGGSGLIGLGAQLTGRAKLRRNARLGALTAVGLGGVALVADLGRPDRFYNMLRTFKITSPMSVGSWILSAFSGGMGVAAVAEVDRMTGERLPLGPLRGVLRAVEGPAGLEAGVFAAPLAVYTAVLLSDTATPTWNAAHRDLPFVFVSSASLASAGLAMVTTPVAETGPVRTLAALGVIGDITAMKVLERRMDPVAAEPLHHGTAGQMLRWSERLAVAGGLGAVLGGRNRLVAAASGLALLAASALTRFGVFEAGIHSAKDPRYTIEPQKRRLAARRAAGITDDSITTA